MAFWVTIGLEGRERRMAVERPPMGRKPDRVKGTEKVIISGVICLITSCWSRGSLDFTERDATSTGGEAVFVDMVQ